MGDQRWGLTIPFDNVPLHDQKQWIEDVVAAGYTDLWSSEAGGTDGFTPLVLASQWAPSARLGVAIVPAFTRGPGLMAMSVAAMAETAPGRFAFGISQALGMRAGGNSLDNTIRVVQLVPTDWMLIDVRIQAVVHGFGHGLAHIWAQDGTLLATASQSAMVRSWREEPPRG